jgi:hypothetical protein
MSNILFDASENIGGNVRRIFIVSYKSSPSIQVADGIVTNFLNLTDWDLIDFTNDSLSFVQEPVVVMGDSGFKKTIEGFIPKERVEVSIELLRYHKQRVVVVVEDRNGLKKVIGTDKRPAVLRFKINNGPKMSDINRYIVNIDQSDLDPAPTYILE